MPTLAVASNATIPTISFLMSCFPGKFLLLVQPDAAARLEKPTRFTGFIGSTRLWK
jgi:hypothetical protein